MFGASIYTVAVDLPPAIDWTVFGFVESFFRRYLAWAPGFRLYVRVRHIGGEITKANVEEARKAVENVFVKDVSIGTVTGDASPNGNLFMVAWARDTLDVFVMFSGSNEHQVLGLADALREALGLRHHLLSKESS